MVASKEPIMSQSERRFSFEFFPAKTEAGHEKLLATARNLAGYKPDFFSCTYGAGGSTRDRTLSTVLQLDGEVKVPTAPHLSCVGDSKAELRELLGRYREAGIRRIVALRGDLP
ncbi:TPA: methylenetetrahydrofolate reductase [NAD(P)H], partial [Pseudomonas aeruginosa]|nr:methylenetetrahydrofolate reductase [NAD(P)H] [Pseudomonas aeruginosa]